MIKMHNIESDTVYIVYPIPCTCALGVEWLGMNDSENASDASKQEAITQGHARFRKPAIENVPTIVDFIRK